MDPPTAPLKRTAVHQGLFRSHVSLGEGENSLVCFYELPQDNGPFKTQTGQSLSLFAYKSKSRIPWNSEEKVVIRELCSSGARRDDHDDFTSL